MEFWGGRRWRKPRTSKKSGRMTVAKKVCSLEETGKKSDSVIEGQVVIRNKGEFRKGVVLGENMVKRLNMETYSSTGDSWILTSCRMK